MEYRDFIKKGNKVAFIPSYDRIFGWGCDVEPQVVTIGEYRPYYTDGSPDPKPEEYNAYCYVEIEEDVAGECQMKLGELYAIIPEKEEKTAVWGTDICKIVGSVDCLEDDYYVLEDDGELKVVPESDFYLERDIRDLSEDELKELRKEIRVGSLFISDYENSFGVNPDYLCAVCEGYLEYLEERYGKEERKHDTPDEFAWYASA